MSIQTRTLARSLIKWVLSRGGWDTSRDYWIFKGRWFSDGIMRSEIAGITLQKFHTSSLWESVYVFTSLGGLSQDSLLHVSVLCVKTQDLDGSKKAKCKWDFRPRNTECKQQCRSEQHWQYWGIPQKAKSLFNVFKLCFLIIFSLKGVLEEVFLLFLLSRRLMLIYDNIRKQYRNPW